jgi:hypothetical protein
VRPLGFFVLILASCQGAPEPAAPKKPLRDFRGIIHCHSKYSHDSQGTYEEILAAAKAAKVDFICMTDHPPSDDKGRPLREGWTGVHDGVLFIQGAEYSDQLLGLGLKEPLESGLDRRAKIKAIHAQGGVAIACHPEEITDWSEYDEADGMEIYNVHATLKRKGKDKTFMLQVAKALKERPEQSFQLLQELDPAIIKKFDEINQTRSIVGVAGNDAHQNVSFFGFQLDPYPRAFKFVSTHVLAEELTQAAILRALKTGQAYVAFDISRPIRLGLQDTPPNTEGVVQQLTGLGGTTRESPLGRDESRLPQRQEWWLPAEKGRMPWVLFPYTKSPPVAHWP